MRPFILGSAALMAALSLGGVAQAAGPDADVVGMCDLATVDKCKFSGNITLDHVGNVDKAYNEEQDGGDFVPTQLLNLAGMQSAIFTPTASVKSGTQVSDFAVSYFGVKAGNGFWLYELTAPATSFQWSTADLGNKKLSHLVWFGAEDVVIGVPEPATWAMMLTGFFGIGSLLRARRRAIAG